MFVVKKAARFDRAYEIGEVVPTEVLNMKNVWRLVSMGILVEVDDKAEDEDLPLMEDDEGRVWELVDLTSMSKADLINYGQDNGVPVKSSMSKDSIIEMISGQMYPGEV